MGDRRDVDDIARTTVNITAENQFSEYIYIAAGLAGHITISGSGTSKITLQLLKVGEANPQDIADQTKNGRYRFCGGGDFWRAGCKTGDYTSGTRTVTLQG